MSSNYGAIPANYLDDDFPDDEWGDEYYYEEVEEPFYEWIMHEERPFATPYLNGWTVVGGILLLIFIYAALFSNEPVSYARSSVTDSPPQLDVRELVGDVTAVTSPYPEYTITQGLHGQSYGHLAIDLAAGRGEPIYSPINGRIAERYIDEYSNPTLVIENDVYIVTFLHGDYSVEVGDTIEIGQQIGQESNHGYTKDMLGNLCYGREYCGNHTHLNIYDKRIQANVNPLDLIRNPISSH